jgi:eukaryotic-like serine/threonine-protein kinase
MSEGGTPASLRQRAAARVGTTLTAKYRIDRLLGLGGMAAVYAATHTRNENRVAVKVLHPEISLNEEVRARFLREGYVANKVGHRGAVRVLDDEVADDGAVFLVMELLEGETLEDRWVRGGRRLGEEDALRVADHLLDILAAAHEKGIVHRDIKPANVFVTSEREVKVLDFGIARLREGAGPGTQTGIAMGTPGFMAPEQAQGKSSLVDAQTDVWAVGATLFTLLSGEQLHRAETMNLRMLAAMTKAAPPLASVVPGVPEAVARVVDRALAFEKSGRWGTAREMQEAVREACREVAGDPCGSREPEVVEEAPGGSKAAPLNGPEGTALLVPPLRAALPKTEPFAGAGKIEPGGSPAMGGPNVGPPASGDSLVSGRTASTETLPSRRVTTLVAVGAVVVAGATVLGVALLGSKPADRTHQPPSSAASVMVEVPDPMMSVRRASNAPSVVQAPPVASASPAASPRPSSSLAIPAIDGTTAAGSPPTAAPRTSPTASPQALPVPTSHAIVDPRSTVSPTSPHAPSAALPDPPAAPTAYNPPGF